MPRPRRNTNDNDDINDSEISEDRRLIFMLIERKIDKIVAKFTEELNNRDKKIETLEQKVTQLQQNLGRLEEKLDEADAYERRDTIIFSGNGVLAAKTGEIVSDVVCAIVKDKLKIKMSPSDISTSHRLGSRPKTQGPDTRNIIVKLCRRELKHELISASKQVMPENIYLNENLTPTRNHLLFVLRRAKGKFPNVIAGCSSMDGKVYTWVKPPNPDSPSARNTKLFINSQGKLDEICQKTLNTTVEDILR